MSAMNMKRIIKTDTMTEFLNMVLPVMLKFSHTIFEGSGTSLTFRSIPRMFKYDFFRLLSFRIDSFT